MAATERDIREMLARDWEQQKPKPERHTEAGTKMALDILHHYKFPGDPSSTTQQIGDNDGSNGKEPAGCNPRERMAKKVRGKETKADP